MTEAATIYDVAREAGVSISTVSNVINRPSRVAAATRERVLAAADALGFTPKAQAVNQATQGVGRIGVVAPFTTYASFMGRLSGVLREVRGRSVDVSVFDVESAATAAAPLLDTIPVRGRLDGLIVMGESMSPATERRLHERGLPVVVVDATSEYFSVVTIDEAAGGRVAAEHLLERGHRRIGYLQERQASEYPSQARRRLAGFAERLGTVPGTQLRVEETEGSVAGAQAAATRLLAADEPPTAIMTHFDELAVGALRAARTLGLEVPHNLSVMGFDDGPVAEASDLTTVRQPLAESGALAVRVLLTCMNASEPRTTTSLNCMLVVRGTVAAPADVRHPSGPAAKPC